MRRYLVVLVLLILVLYVTAEVVFTQFLPAYRFRFLGMIPAFFVFLGVLTVNIAQLAHGHGINVIMGTKVLKMVLSLLILFAYALLVKVTVMSFVLTFAVFFLAYLIYESWMFLDLNKKKTNNEL